MHTESIAYAHAGTDYIGYFAAPANATKRPGILICGEGNGLGSQVKARAEQLAQLGYSAFCLDFIGGGQVLATLPEMMAKLGTLRADLTKTRALGRVGLDLLTARAETDPTKLAAIGYCFGGQLALELARDGAPLAATVAFHANLGARDPGEAKRITGKVLACIGADDPIVPPAERAAFEAEMRGAGVDWRLYLYGGAVHGFANPNAGAMGNAAVAYHAPSHRRSWREMLALFDEVFSAA